MGATPQQALAVCGSLRTTVERLEQLRGIAVVVVGGAPTYRRSFPSPSVLRPDLRPPVLTRRAVDEVSQPVVAAERRALRSLDQVAYVDPVPLLCRATCSPFFGGRWRYLDGYDLNQYGARLLTTEIARAVDQAVAQPG